MIHTGSQSFRVRLLYILILAAGLGLVGIALLFAPDLQPSLAAPTFLSPVLDISKTAQGNVAGAPVTYTITVSNAGADPATGVVITDVVPAGANFVSATDGGSLNAGEVEWTDKTVSAFSNLQVSFTVTTCQAITLDNEEYGVTSDEGVSDSGPLVQTILQEPTLNADFQQTPNPSAVGVPVLFTDTSTTNGSPIVARSWDFGDGGQGMGTAPPHTYTGPGTFDVTLTVTDSCGYTDTATFTHETISLASDTLTITKEATGTFVVGSPLTYTVIVSNAHPTVSVPGVVVTDAVPIDGVHVSGGTLSDDIVTLNVGTVPAAGQASATWVVSTCAASLTNQWYRVITSTPGLTTTWGAPLTTDFPTEPTLNPDFTMSSSYAWVNVPVTFEDASTTNGGPITAWHWDFDDGSSDTGTPIDHTYTNTGTVTVTLTITDSCGYSQAVSKPIEVRTPAVYLPLVLRPGLIYVPLVIEDQTS